MGGVKYYHVPDLFNLPFQRALEAISAYEILRMKCSLDYLKKHTKRMDEILEAPKFGFSSAMEIQRLNNQLKERLEFAFIPDHIYNLAAVVFFDDNEKPEHFDSVYAQKKIVHWKKHTATLDFFLQKRIRELVPFLDAPAENLQTYLALIEEVNKKHLENISTKLQELPQEAMKSSPSASSAKETQPN